MISLLISILVALLFLALIWYVLSLLPLPPPVSTIILLILALVVVLAFLGHGGVIRF